MEGLEFHKWVCFLLTMLTIFHPSHAREAQSIISDSNFLKPFIIQLFKWRRYQIQSQQRNLHMNLPTISAGLLCFGAASVSSAGGIGGGGLFLPILNIIAGLDLKTATTFTAFMVTGGSVANVMCHLLCYNKLLGGGTKHMIDYDIALLSEPCMLLGVSVGVICNTVFPDWLITLLFVVFLVYSTFKTWRCGVLYWRSESNGVKRDGVCNMGNGVLRNGGLEGGDGGSGVKEPLLGEEGKEHLAMPWKKLVVLVIVWVCFFGLYVIRGGRNRQSVIKVEPCGAAYWIISSFQIPLAMVFTAFVLYQKDGPQCQTSSQQETVAPARIESRSKLIFPLAALVSGILGGLFGIGGGMLINPVLLQMGIPPQVTAATSAFMVFFSSSMSSVQYLMLGMKHVDHALMFAVGCFIASLLGLSIIQRAITKYGRVSLIVFSVATVMALSTALITSFGLLDVWKEYESGAYMGFRLPC